MTVPSSRTHARRRFASRLTALFAAAAVVSGIAAAPAGASVTPRPTPTAETATGTIAFTIAPIRNGILNPGEALTASVTIDNGTALVTPSALVTLEVGTATIDDRAALTAWLGGDTSGVALAPVGSETLEPVSPLETRTTAIMVAPDQPDIAALSPGVHPLRASYDTPAGTVQSTSVVVVPTAEQSVGVGVVVPITAGPQAEPLLTSAQLAEYTDDGGTLTEQLDGVDSTSAILAIDPAILAAIRALGVSAPPSAIAWLERLEGLPNTRFALQFGDADPAVQVEAGMPRPLAPTTFSPFLDAADFPVSASPTPSPTPTASASPAPDAPLLPSSEALLDTLASREAVYWPAAASVTPSSVASLGALGDGETAALTLIPSTAASPGGARGVAGEAGVLVYDADVSRSLTAAASVDESALRAAPLAAASAYLSLADADAGEAPVLAVIDRGTDRSYLGLQTAISAAAGYPGAVPHSLSTLSAAAPRTVSIADAATPADRVAAATALVADEGELAKFATILDDPALLTAPERATILQLLAVAWGQEPQEAAVAVTEHRADTRETLDSVHLLPTTTINLFAAGAGLPFTVRNDLPYPVNLVLYATPDDLRLSVRRANELVATPQSNTRIDVPVEARVGNGEVTLGLQLRSPSFVAVGPAQTVDVNVRAEWEAVGVVILSVLVGGLLLLGIIRTVLKARARRAKNDDDTPGSAP